MDKTNPQHYGNKGMQPIDLIEENKLNFSLGNVVKYVCRAGRKKSESNIDDLEKAAWYLAREIDRIKNKL